MNRRNFLSRAFAVLVGGVFVAAETGELWLPTRTVSLPPLDPFRALALDMYDCETASRRLVSSLEGLGQRIVWIDSMEDLTEFFGDADSAQAARAYFESFEIKL